MRIAVFTAGLAMLVWGGYLFAEFALPLGPQGLVAAAWLFGGPLAHDLLVAPVVGVVGLLLIRALPAAWRAPVRLALVLTAMLGLLAFPLLWREFGTPPSPGLHDADTTTGLLLTLAVVWTVSLAAGAYRQLAPARSGD
ncbi:hypothetical protein CFN78_07965 [Amycolatopsis antarctica]|uniref:Transmembrane protein n=1 Tax=Amycolatopsis antarctica TaxID=1854586 RepID=A0A263D5L7_9PSEU|nr:hypothetical protein [Amycolatopsis antarctica]OZM73479.1 hypothetical protein CFN78_07965 [Amycolatopsis antarctica]